MQMINFYKNTTYQPNTKPFSILWYPFITIEFEESIYLKRSILFLDFYVLI